MAGRAGSASVGTLRPPAADPRRFPRPRRKPIRHAGAQGFTTFPETLEVGIIWTIIIGFIVGLIAKFLMPGRDPGGFIITTILGIIGAVVATYLGQAVGWYGPGQGAGFIASIVGAVIVLFIYRMVARRSNSV